MVLPKCGKCGRELFLPGQFCGGRGVERALAAGLLPAGLRAAYI